MLDLLAASHNIQESGGMIGIYNPLGIITVCGIVYLIICLAFTIYKGDLFLEFKGLMIVFALWFSLSYFFVFRQGLSGSSVVTLDGIEVTAGEIGTVLDYICNTRQGIGGMDDRKYKAIKRHLMTYPVRREDRLLTSDQSAEKAGRCDIHQDGEVYEVWELRAGEEYNGRLPSDFDYFYKQPGRDAGVPSRIYHPTMWFWCPLIAMVFSRPLWCLFFLMRILDGS